MGLINNSEVEFAIKKLINAIAKPVAVILVFVALVLFLMKAISGISAR